MKERKSLKLALSQVFVPLSGLASVNGVLLAWDSTGFTTGFRPLIGVSFCKLSRIKDGAKVVVGFRPLIGVSFCKLNHI